MNWHSASIEVRTTGKGLYDITEKIQIRLSEWNVMEGMCFLFLPHTSASLLTSENWDPSARNDIETFMERLVPEKAAWYTHTLEGSDDATSHIRAMLSGSNLFVPVDDGRLSLGTWQGIYLFEHRAPAHVRKILLRVMDFR
jgi:secondary thiamine-phosphate synthase enzyme